MICWQKSEFEPIIILVRPRFAALQQKQLSAARARAAGARSAVQSGATSATQEPSMIQGLRTVIYPVNDLARAKAWFTEVLGQPPYFDQPFYVGFAVGGFELGLVPDGQAGTSGSIAYWGVENIDTEVARVTGMGATLQSAIQEVGDGIRVAELKDPFGNLLGLIYNPHFDRAAVR
jgi:predicted enzyme related to lactoylglutathione lyase